MGGKGGILQKLIPLVTTTLYGNPVRTIVTAMRDFGSVYPSEKKNVLLRNRAFTHVDCCCYFVSETPTLGISAAASTSHYACVLYCLARRNLPNRRLGNQKKNEHVIRDLPERTMSFKEKGKPPPVLSYSSSSANARTSYTTHDPLPRSKGRNSCITVTKVSYGIGIACAG